MGTLNLNSTEATTRVGVRINTRYQRVCAELGLQVGQTVIGQASGAATVGSNVFTFTGVEKIDRVYWVDSNSNPVFLEREISLDDMRLQEEGGLASSDRPTEYAIQVMGPGSVTIRANTKAATTYTLKCDGLDVTDTLSASLVPQFTTNYHYILIEGVLSDELRKMDKFDEAGAAEAVYDAGLSKLRLFYAKSANKSWVSQQGRSAPCQRCGFCS